MLNCLAFDPQTLNCLAFELFLSRFILSTRSFLLYSLSLSTLLKYYRIIIFHVFYHTTTVPLFQHPSKQDKLTFLAKPRSFPLQMLFYIQVYDLPGTLLLFCYFRQLKRYLTGRSWNFTNGTVTCHNCCRMLERN